MSIIMLKKKSLPIISFSSGSMTDINIFSACMWNSTGRPLLAHDVGGILAVFLFL